MPPAPGFPILVAAPSTPSFLTPMLTAAPPPPAVCSHSPLLLNSIPPSLSPHCPPPMDPDWLLQLLRGALSLLLPSAFSPTPSPRCSLLVPLPGLQLPLLSLAVPLPGSLSPPGLTRHVLFFILRHMERKGDSLFLPFCWLFLSVLALTFEGYRCLSSFSLSLWLPCSLLQSTEEGRIDSAIKTRDHFKGEVTFELPKPTLYLCFRSTKLPSSAFHSSKLLECSPINTFLVFPQPEHLMSIYSM